MNDFIIWIKSVNISLDFYIFFLIKNGVFKYFGINLMAFC
jgi:hypothetical protein